MENNNLKLIWKIGVNEDLKSYSDTELNKMIIKCARKSMRKIYPGWILRIAVLLVIALALWKIVTGYENFAAAIYWFIILLILIVSMGIEEWSARKMNQYNFNMPVKEWIKFRIDKIKKSIQFQRKYDIAIYVGSFIMGFGSYLMHNYLMEIPFNIYIFTTVFIVIFLSSLGCRIMVIKHYQKVFSKLQELYNKLEE